MKKPAALLLVMVALLTCAAEAQQPPATDSKFPVFTTAAAAQHHCSFDVVVWLNTKTDIYTIGGPPAGATPEDGAYMCQRDADQMDYKSAPAK